MNPLELKAEFPIFQSHPSLCYLDSAASSHKPRVVIDRVTRFYAEGYASINRGLYRLGAQVTQEYEAVRARVADFIGAGDAREIVYTSGTTDGINLVAQSFLAPRLKAGDEVLITAMEHHANLIPWQEVCRASGATLRIAPINDRGELKLEEFEALIADQTRMIALTHISNTLGTINPVETIIQWAHDRPEPIPVLVDAAQSAAHYPLRVADMDCDFLVFSGHKIFGPTGIGVLYGKSRHLAQMQPVRFGGDMIETVGFERALYAEPPRRFEAGTTNIAGVMGLGAAVDFIRSLDRPAVLGHLEVLRKLATGLLTQIPGVRIIGEAEKKSGLVSFVLEDVHPHDMATFLGERDIAIRAGHHCTQPLMDMWGLPGTVRASFSVYNQEEDLHRLAEGVEWIRSFFK